MAVYFIRAGETPYVKIGSAVNVKRRIGFLQVGNHEPLKLLRQIPGGVPEERWLQRHFKNRQLVREWFLFDEEMLSVTVPPIDAPERRQEGRGHVDVLRAHLANAGIDSDEFGAQFNPPISGSAVRKWIAGARIPRAQQLAQIKRLTGGAVTTNDFYAPYEASA